LLADALRNDTFVIEMCGDSASECIFVDLHLPCIETDCDDKTHGILQSFEQKFEKMLFSKILDKETYMTMSNKEHNDIISQLFSAKKL
jgi:hypothetical protein